MKNKSVIQLLFILAMLLWLAACSTVGSGTDNSSAAPAGAVGGSVSTTGLGGPQMIAGFNTSRAYRLSAPYNQIYFYDFDQYHLHQKYLASIDAQANYLVSHLKARVLIIGNADQRGSPAYNVALSRRRALSVIHRLQLDGVNNGQIKRLYLGASKPLAPGHTERDYAINRNVQLIYEAK